MASKAASEVSKTPTKKRKSGEDYEAPSSQALVAVAATAYASLGYLIACLSPDSEFATVVAPLF